MDFAILGPLSVERAGSPVAVARPRVRLLLALLLANANTPMTMDTLIVNMWGTAPVRSARSNLKTYISTLRAALSPDDPAAAPIRTTRNGYALEVSRESVDALRFEDLLARAAASRRAGADDTGDLETALTLWRGDPFADVRPSCPDLDVVAHRLAELRVGAAERLVAARLAAGRQAEVIGDLRAWVARYPLREQLWEQLMIALYRDGRPADALDAYRQLRELMVEQLGMEPGPSLRQLQRRILNGDAGLLAVAGVPVVPLQLPMDTGLFVGRRSELELIGRMLAMPGAVVVVHGAAGAGKSALAVRAAHAAAARFPDGQLYADLLATTPGAAPLTAHECLGRFLRALGVAGPDVPSDEHEAAALFRSVIARRRMLIVLDNAAGVAQVRPLLPATPGTAVVVTSRDRLAAMSGASHVTVEPLPSPDAVTMLERLVSRRGSAEDMATLAQLCGRLPLGIQIAAARLDGRRDWVVADMVNRLANADNRLSELYAGGDSLHARLEITAVALCRSDSDEDREAGHAFGIFGALDVEAIDPFVAAAMLDRTTGHAERILERLAETHLLEADLSGRFHRTDLIRLVARENPGREVPPADLRAAAERGLRYYLATVRYATALVCSGSPCRSRTPTPSLVHRLPDADAAHNWLATETRNLLAVAAQALSGDHTQAEIGVGLTVALHRFLAHTPGSTRADGLVGRAAVVAERAGDTAARTYLRRCAASQPDLAGRLTPAGGYATIERGHRTVREFWASVNSV